jgi:hypothetical protein
MTTKMKPLLCCVIIFGVQLWTVCAKEPDAPGTNLTDLTLTIQCTNAVLRMGDEIPVEFVISNCGMATTPTTTAHMTGAGEWENTKSPSKRLMTKRFLMQILEG